MLSHLWNAKRDGAAVPKKFECLNDGTCGPSDDKERAKWTDYNTCASECGGGNWKCVKGVAGARAGAHHCTPDDAGTAAKGSAGACEAACTG